MEQSSLLSTLLVVVLCSSFRLGKVASIKIVRDAGMVYYVEGRPFQLGCTTRDDVDADTVKWIKDVVVPVDGMDGYKIYTWRGTDEKGPYLRTTLTVENLGDPAAFLCRIEGGEEYIDVDMLSAFTQGANVSEGLDASLRCEFTPDDLSQNLTWAKDGVPLEEIPGLQGRYKLGNNNVTLNIQKAQSSDAGIYSCTIALNHGMYQTFTENVTLQGKPYMKSSPGEKLVTSTSRSLTLSCPAHGYSPPEVFWMKDEDILEASSKYIMSDINGATSAKLEIITPTKADYGEYICIAENLMGKAETSFTVVNATTAHLTDAMNKGEELAVGVASLMVMTCGLVLAQVV